MWECSTVWSTPVHRARSGCISPECALASARIPAAPTSRNEIPSALPWACDALIYGRCWTPFPSPRPVRSSRPEAFLRRPATTSARWFGTAADRPPHTGGSGLLPEVEARQLLRR